MHRNRLNIEFIGTGQEPKTILWSLKNIDHVEQLIYSILDAKGVGPVYWQLFGIRLVKEPNIWLAPNIRTETLLESHLGTSPGTLELRLRYRPSSYTKLFVLDKTAFEIIFAQIRYDFLHTEFTTTEKRDYILLNESVLALITNDLIRHALENNINDDEILKCVKLDKFIPQKAYRWQRPFFYLLRKKLNMPKSIQVGFKTCDGNISKVKKAFIEIFLYDVCPDYASETYRIICIDDPKSPISMDIRVRYCQTRKDSSCLVEGCFATQDSKRIWNELCNIYTICYGTIHGDIVEIDRMNGKLLRFKFSSALEAYSFTSLIDGYYRLMRKWNFNFCRGVTSPDLEFLRKIRCHGPIGLESMRLKLNKLKKPGSFIIRRCMDMNNRFLIDVILQSKIRLSIDIEWNSENRSYSMLGHSQESDPKIKIDIYLNKPEYKDLNLMIQDMQIKIINNPTQSNHPPQQLKHWIPPTEHDDCPALLLSIPKSKIVEFDNGNQRLRNSLEELPKIFPPQLIQSDGNIIIGIPNRMLVRILNLEGEQSVIIKEHVDDDDHDQQAPTKSRLQQHNDLVLYHDSVCQRNMHFVHKLKPAQHRLADWIFVKSKFVADTIGLDLTRNALIQEHLPYGPLNKYLSGVCAVPRQTFRSIIYQLSSTLLFLQDNRIIHGKLRCHNFLIKSMNPLQIKLTDPLGTFDAFRDRAYLPPEYSGLELMSRLNSDGLLRIKEYEPGIDVWAFGTVLWQIYSLGRRLPLGQFANLLTKPPGCPDKIWEVIESCWAMEADSRASPQKIFRDLNDEFGWQISKSDYEYVSNGSNNNFTDSETSSTPTTPDHFTYNRRMSPDISYSSDATSKPINSTDGSEIDLILASPATSTRTSSYSSERSAYLLTRNHGNATHHRQPIMSWRNLFRYSEYHQSRNNCQVTYSKQDNTSSVSSTARSDSDCSTPSVSDDSKVIDTLNSMCTSEFRTSQSSPADMMINLSRIKLTTELGRGVNGTVFKGILTLDDSSNQVVAVKVLHKQQEESIEVDDLKQEYEMLKNLNHENIVKTLGLVGNEDSVMLVMEFMPFGSLNTRLKSMQPDELVTLPLHNYAYDIAKGMEYLESMKIVHRDLALRNILVDSYNHVKICDFGLARNVNYGNCYELQTDRPLPIKWYAPEVLKNWTFTHESDVWSYGVVLWEIYSGGDIPQYSGSYAELVNTLQEERLLKPKGCPVEMYSLMLQCWALNPECRGNFAQIRNQLECFRPE